MLKAIKETMRAWLLAHEKLYWFIVMGLAFTAFLLITMFGFAKLERAEAAVDISCDLNGVSGTYTAYDIRECDWSEWAVSDEALKKYSSPSSLCDKIVDECDYMIVVYDGATYYYYFGSSPILLTKGSKYENYSYVSICSVETYYSKNYIIGVKIKDGKPVIHSVNGLEDLDNYHSVDRSQEIFYKTRNLSMLGSNYDIFEGYTDTYFDEVKAGVPYNNLTFSPDDVFGPRFVPIGPYLRLNDDYYYNTPYSNSVHDNESIAGVPLLGTCSYKNWKWIYKGSVYGYFKDYEGEDTNIVSNTKAQITLDVGIPSRAWVSDCIENMKLVSELRALRTEEKRYEWVNTRFRDGKMEDCVLSYSLNLPVTRDSKEFELTFTYTDMLEKIREVLGIEDWAEYYGCTDVQWKEFWSHIVFGYLIVNQMDSITFNQYSDTDIIYGCYVTDVFTSGYNYSGYVYQDFFADPKACLSAMNTELDEAYEAVIAESEKKIAEYEAELEVINKELELLRSDDIAIFDVFTDLANSLKNATVGFRSLSVAIGNVFAFFPPEVMSCYMFAFMAIIVISIVKALRG